MDEESSDVSEEVFADKKTKKRKLHGRMAEVAKKIKLASHEPGSPCRCRMRCYQKITKEAREKILQNFNLLESHDAQNSYLSGLISVLPVKRISKNENARHYDAVYNKYRVLAIMDSLKEIPVCKKGAEGKKGSDNVCSLLHHFVYNFMSDGTKHLEIFCDSCSGQNKNFTIFRFLHHLVHVEKKLESVKMTFPIRGHSYLECDKNMGLVKTTTRTEIPDDWLQVFTDARQKPMPFDVVKVDRTFFRSWTTHFETIYTKKSTFPARPIKELKITKSDTKILYRSTYNGMWEKVSIAGRNKRSLVNLQEKEFILPELAYKDALPISAEKFKDLQVLKKFCSPEAAAYFTNIKHV